MLRKVDETCANLYQDFMSERVSLLGALVKFTQFASRIFQGKITLGFSRQDGNLQFTAVNTTSSAYNVCVVFANRRVVSVNMGSYFKDNVMCKDHFILRSYKKSIHVVLQVFLQLCLYVYWNKQNFRLPR